MDRCSSQSVKTAMPQSEPGGNVMTTAPRVTSCDECRDRNSRFAGSPVTLVDRREFVARSAIGAAGALLLAACGGGSESTGPGSSGGVSLDVTVSNFPALSTIGGIARVDSGVGTPVAAVRTSATSFSAFSLICPHFGCTVGVASRSFACPCHGARFAADGHWTGGQPTGNLTALTTSYDATTNMLTITG
jgi:Rieske Fe-S protein